MIKIPVTPLGQCGFRFQFGDSVLYIDPYLSDKVAEVEGEELRRLVPIKISPDKIVDADYVLVTHAHMDHCDLDTLIPLSKASSSCEFICPNEVAKILHQAGVENDRIIVANESCLTLRPELRITPVPAAHPSVEIDEDNCFRCLGYVMEFAGRKLYHAGDGSPNDQVFDRLSQLSPIDIGFIPVNERNYYREKRGIIGNMTVREAFQMAEEINLKILVPTHWDMFALNCVYQEELEQLYELMSPSFDMRLNPEEL